MSLGSFTSAAAPKTSAEVRAHLKQLYQKNVDFLAPLASPESDPVILSFIEGTPAYAKGKQIAEVLIAFPVLKGAPSQERPELGAYIKVTVMDEPHEGINMTRKLRDNADYRIIVESSDRHRPIVYASSDYTDEGSSPARFIEGQIDTFIQRRMPELQSAAVTLLDTSLRINKFLIARAGHKFTPEAF